MASIVVFIGVEEELSVGGGCWGGGSNSSIGG